VAGHCAQADDDRLPHQVVLKMEEQLFYRHQMAAGKAISTTISKHYSISNTLIHHSKAFAMVQLQLMQWLLVTDVSVPCMKMRTSCRGSSQRRADTGQCSRRLRFKTQTRVLILKTAIQNKSTLDRVMCRP
jgi:hypothetical protein